MSYHTRFTVNPLIVGLDYIGRDTTLNVSKLFEVLLQVGQIIVELKSPANVENNICERIVFCILSHTW
jgi:hypothetical protein